MLKSNRSGQAKQAHTPMCVALSLVGSLIATVARRSYVGPRLESGHCACDESSALRATSLGRCKSQWVRITKPTTTTSMRHIRSINGLFSSTMGPTTQVATTWVVHVYVEDTQLTLLHQALSFVPRAVAPWRFVLLRARARAPQKGIHLRACFRALDRFASRGVPQARRVPAAR